MARRPGLGVALSALTVLLVSALLSPLSGTAAEETYVVGDECGPAVFKSNGRQWECTFHDHFTGSSLDDSKWSPLETYLTGAHTGDCRIDDAQLIRVRDGALHLTVRDEGRQFFCKTRTGGYWTRYSAGGVHSMRNFEQTFGRFEVRARFPHSVIKGLHSAIWTWPVNKTYGDLSGELDIVEWRSGIPNRAVPTIHYDSGPRAGDKTNWHCYIDDPQNFHTYAMEWNRFGVSFIYDGQVCLTHSWDPAGRLRRPAPFDEPFFMILNQSAGRYLNSADQNTEFPATMAVDYVKVWR